jgi:hypothetical protein
VPISTSGRVFGPWPRNVFSMRKAANPRVT